MLRRSFIHGQWILVCILALLAALLLAWQVLAKANFLYPLWYEILTIDQTIATYGPRNRYRNHFENTTKTERIRLFRELVEAVHRHGRSLEVLVYHDSRGRPIASLLTPLEIIHLKDVARLIDCSRAIGLGAWLVLPGLLGLLALQKQPMPPLRRLLLGITLGLTVISGIIVLAGPVKVFYSLHTWLFPQEHRWFFYYEDSLMTMLMQAPVIFGYITLTLAALGMLFLFGILALVKKVYPRF
jgi:hypothetical protein